MLKDITHELILQMNATHHREEGQINDKISRLFASFADNTCPEDVKIKVAVLNTLYNTGIQYILPVVRQINLVFAKPGLALDAVGHHATVDLIATTEWTSSESGRKEKRCNLSFASKFMHFQTQREVPIYDSYVWLMMNGYLQSSGHKVSFTPPKTYRQFYARFSLFKEQFGLQQYSNYQLDKFLWQYSKQLLEEIRKREKVNLPKAKSLLKQKFSATDAACPAI